MNRTDNEIMFQCEVDILKNSPDHADEVHSFILDYILSQGEEINNNFSFDNWKLVACWDKKFENTTEYIPIWGRHSWRPDNLAFFLWIRFPTLLSFLLPVISLSMIISMLRVWRTTADGRRYIDTDGKIISYFVCECFDMRATRWALECLIKRDKDLKSWENIFKIYFPENHYVLEAFYGKRRL